MSSSPGIGARSMTMRAVRRETVVSVSPRRRVPAAVWPSRADAARRAVGSPESREKCREVSAERARLDELEAIIEHGIAAYVRSGNALREVRDSRLYRESHATFEDYCQARWGVARRTAYQLIEAADVANGLCAIAHTIDSTPERAGKPVPLPATESVAQLVPLKKQPEAMREVWKQVQASGLVTAAFVAESWRQNPQPR